MGVALFGTDRGWDLADWRGDWLEIFGNFPILRGSEPWQFWFVVCNLYHDWRWIQQILLVRSVLFQGKLSGHFYSVKNWSYIWDDLTSVDLTSEICCSGLKSYWLEICPGSSHLSESPFGPSAFDVTVARSMAERRHIPDRPHKFFASPLFFVIGEWVSERVGHTKKDAARPLTSLARW